MKTEMKYDIIIWCVDMQISYVMSMFQLLCNSIRVMKLLLLLCNSTYEYVIVTKQQCKPGNENVIVAMEQQSYYNYVIVAKQQ